MRERRSFLRFFVDVHEFFFCRRRCEMRREPFVFQGADAPILLAIRGGSTPRAAGRLKASPGGTSLRPRRPARAFERLPEIE
jgi:hypothetical protein